jgi:hypothetical protein
MQRLGLTGDRLQGVLIDQLLAQEHSAVLECIAPPTIARLGPPAADAVVADAVRLT